MIAKYLELPRDVKLLYISDVNSYYNQSNPFNNDAGVGVSEIFRRGA